MALLLKKIYQGYFYVINDLADPRAEDLFMMNSPLPLVAILTVWWMFIFKWGPAYMKDRKPFTLKRTMMVYNLGQVIVNLYLLYNIWIARSIVSWRCTEIDYSRSYWGMTILKLCYIYFFLKLADLLDTVFFVLRKKTNHLSFLHIYHHFGMVCVTWFAVKFVAGGHFIFLGYANCPVHVILYSYYLLTAYDNKYAKLLWLKKFITQTQLFQFVFLSFIFGQLLFRHDCQFPKLLVCIMITQNLFMMVLFGEFYFRTYHLEPRRRRRALEEKKKMQELEEKEKNENAQKKSDS